MSITMANVVVKCEEVSCEMTEELAFPEDTSHGSNVNTLSTQTVGQVMCDSINSSTGSISSVIPPTVANDDLEKQLQIKNEQYLDSDIEIGATEVQRQEVLETADFIFTKRSHPTSSQLGVLLEFLEQNPRLAKGHIKTQNARERSRRLWEGLSLRLNSMGGTVKSYQKWVKYWSDKKSAVKKKAVARAAARRRAGGGLDDDPNELTEVEERIVALLGGQPCQVLLPSASPQQIDVPQGPGNSEKPLRDDNRASQTPLLARSLLGDVEDLTSTEASPNIRSSLLHSHEENPVIPSPTVISERSVTDSSPIILSPSQSGNTIPVSQVSNEETIQPCPSSDHIDRPSPVPSPSRRGATSRVSRTNRRGRPSAGPSNQPPSQRRTEFSRTTERFIRLEEQRLAMHQSNAQFMGTIMERIANRDRYLIEVISNVGERMAQSINVVGEGLKAIAEAIKHK